MLEVKEIVGNIFLDEEFEELKSKYEDRLQVTRTELEKRILRRKSTHGTDIGLNLKLGVKLCHGDVISNGDEKIIIEQLPEKVLCIRLRTKNMINVMVLLGHIIGNRHRPISIQNDGVIFPIQSDSEKEVFTKLFHSIINYVEIKQSNQIFLPHSGANVHEH